MTTEVLPALIGSSWIVKLAEGFKLPFVVEAVQWGAGYWVLLLERRA